MVLQPGGNSTNFQLLLEIKDSISSILASFQNMASGDAKSSLKV
jgi:hypothetical protein